MVSITKLPIPSKVIQHINESVNDKFKDSLTSRQKIRLVKYYISLWFIIFKEARKDYAQISKYHFHRFEFRTEEIRYKYSTLIEHLKQMNLIEIDESYQFNTENNKCKSYKINQDFINDDFIDIELDIEKIFGGARNPEEYHKLNPNHKDLIDIAYRSSIDTDRAIEFLKNADLTPEKYYHCLVTVIKITIKNLWFKVCSAGRFHSTFTTLPKELVEFIIIDNEKTCNVDTVNSQPLLLSQVINNEQLKKDCEDGIFYEKLMDSYNCSRQEAKELTYTILFSDYEISKKNREMLKTIWPEISSKVDEIKLNAQEKPTDQKRKLWFKLQKQESDIWITVAKELALLGIPVITRHDQIVCKEEHIEIVIDKLLQEYSIYDINPKFKIA